jgi:hypothetical protein
MPEAEKLVIPDVPAFLSGTGPQARKLVVMPFKWKLSNSGTHWADVEFRNFDVPLHCSRCGGVRLFESEDDITISPMKSYNTYVTYACKNCEAEFKIYSLLITATKDAGLVYMQKYGEEPPFNIDVPDTLDRVLGKEHLALFKKGLHAEVAGLGVGAFTYYRRVLDSQRIRILDHLSKAAVKLQADAELIEQIEAAKKETQFTKAVDAVKKGLPPSLYIDGHNPLTLLHDAVSDGVHAATDEDCLSFAQTVRVLLVELVRRIDQALAEEQVVKDAVSRLLKAKAAKEEKKVSPQDTGTRSKS